MTPWLDALRTVLARPEQRAVQIATASAERGPTLRTVILRRVEDSGVVVFFTDTRAEKITQLWEDDRVELHGWWPKPRVQFRLRGRAQISTDDADPLRKEIWDQLGEDDLARFYGPPPGRPSDPSPERGAPPALDGVAETFALVRVVPERVDVLRLSPEGHTRDLHILEDGAWRTEPVTP